MIALLLIITVACSVGILAWLYLFNIYEIKIVVQPEYVIANDRGEVTVRVIPVNSFGKEAPFRKVKVQFQVEKGAELIKSLEKKNNSSIVIIKPNGKVGKIILKVKPELGLFPTLVEIPIIENPSVIKKRFE